MAAIILSLHITSAHLILLFTIGSCICYCLCVTVYRVFFHPIKDFPGPRIAAITSLYRAWYQIVGDGGHLEQWTKLHGIYGDIIRIAPNELHFSAPSAFDEITGHATPFTKAREFWDWMGQADAMLGIGDERRHRDLFKPVASLFNYAFIKTFEPALWDHSRQFCELLHGSQGKPVNMAMGFRALMLDNVLDFVYGRVPPEQQGLRDLSFSNPYLRATFDMMNRSGTWPRRNFRTILPMLLRLVPRSLHKRLLPGDIAALEFDEMTIDMVRTKLEDAKWSRDCFLRRFPEGSTVDYISQEVSATILGGLIDLANVLQYGLFQVSTNQQMLSNLQRELDSVWPSSKDCYPELTKLQQLPLLTGVIMESLRLTHGIITGPPRVAPATGAMLTGVKIPGNILVTTSSYYSHIDERIFALPMDFLPKRWDNPTMAMTKAICSFSKGRRQCPGKQLAMSELYITFAAILHELTFEPYQTSIEDFQLKAYLSGHFKGRQFHAIVAPRRKV